MSRFRFVEAHASTYTVKRLCETAGVSRSGYYAWAKRPPSPRAVANEAVLAEIVDIHTRSRGTYGAPRIEGQLRRRGFCVNHKRVARLMAQSGLVGVTNRRKWRRGDDAKGPLAPDLIGRDFSAGAPDQRWVADITTWAKSHGHKIARWCVDEGVSGTVEATDRPGLACALDAIESGAMQGLVTPKLDRLARSLSVQEAALAHVWRLGGQVFTVDTGEVQSDDAGDPMRTAMRQVMGAFAQLERAMIVQRMAKGRAAKAEAGGYAYGSPPFGWRVENGELVPDEREAPIVARIMELRAGGASTRTIAETLHNEGHRPKRSERFASATIARIIKRGQVGVSVPDGSG